MGKLVLITGGAGFIGSHTANELLAHGYSVRVLDNLCSQVHGLANDPPTYLNREVEFIFGDVRDSSAVKRALVGVDAVYHFAAAVGVGQSMYEITHYTDTNNLGTATVLQALIDRPVERFIVASSMSVYGEGLYKSVSGEVVEGSERSVERLRQGKWELIDKHGDDLVPVATTESKTPNLSSVYALTKYDQERLSLVIGKAYNIPTVALRFFNAYGRHQALSNPYTGVLAIFASRLLNCKNPVIYEDGLQLRDFVSVYDIARACRLAFESDKAIGEVINIGSGQPVSVKDVAEKTAQAIGKSCLHPELTNRYRAGDIRHCFADISKAKSVLGYEPAISLDSGLAELAEWLEGQQAADHIEKAHAELAARGLEI